MRKTLIALLLTASAVAYGADAPTDAKHMIDPTQLVTDPHGHAFLPCGADEPKTCARDQTLGFFIYIALGSQAQRDPRAGPPPLDPEAVARVALGWRVYDASGPVEISETQRVMIRKALFANLTMTNVAYAACRLIGDPGECDKP